MEPLYTKWFARSGKIENVAGTNNGRLFRGGYAIIAVLAPH
jgi:hypothetical protein